MNRRDRMSRVFLSTFHSLLSRPNGARVDCTNCAQLREVARKNGVSVMFRTLGQRATRPEQHAINVVRFHYIGDKAAIQNDPLGARTVRGKRHTDN